QNRARAGADADGQDRRQSAPPAAGARELARRGTVGMAAMLVMDMVVRVVMGVAMAVMMVVVVIVTMIMFVVMVAVIVLMRHTGDRRLRLGRLQSADERTALDPDQAEAERRDQRVACDLDRPLGLAH